MHTSRLKSSGTPPLQPCVLLTGFDAFAGAAVNPSWLAVQTLDGENISGHVLVAAQLPTVFGSAAQVLDRLLKRHKPALVVCTGQAAGRGALSIERIAINVNDARIADNNGDQPVDTPVIPGGPAAYFSTLPIKAMRLAIERGGIAAEISQTAGTFVCNHVFYSLMHALATQNALKKTRGGFVHVPNLPSQDLPSLALNELALAGMTLDEMTLDEMVQGLRLAIACALAVSGDITQSAGALS